MNIDFENINAIIKIGDPFKFNDAVGRIVGFDLESTRSPDGEYPVVLWGTPHGTVIKTGRCYVSKIDNEDDLKKLSEYEQDAIAKGMVPYEGKIEVK